MHAIYRANFGTLSTCAIFRIPRRHQPAHNRLSVHILKFRYTTTSFSTCRPNCKINHTLRPRTQLLKKYSRQLFASPCFRHMTFFDKIMPLRTATRRKQNGHQTAKSRRNTYYMHLSPSGKSTFYMHYHLSGYKLIPLCRISPVKCSLLAKKGAQRSPAYIEETLTHTTTSFFTNLNLSRL